MSEQGDGEEVLPTLPQDEPMRMQTNLYQDSAKHSSSPLSQSLSPHLQGISYVCKF